MDEKSMQVKVDVNVLSICNFVTPISWILKVNYLAKSKTIKWENREWFKEKSWKAKMFQQNSPIILIFF